MNKKEKRLINAGIQILTKKVTKQMKNDFIYALQEYNKSANATFFTQSFKSIILECSIDEDSGEIEYAVTRILNNITQ